MTFLKRPKDALGTLLAVLYALPACAYPFGNDTALHWYLGWRWLHGELPFVSGVSSKPVGMFAVHALTIAALGEEEWAIRITEVLTVVGVGYLIAFCAYTRPGRLEDGWLGLGALAFSGAYYTFFDYWDTAHPELWEGACLAGALAVALRAQKPWSRDAGAGALCMAAFMFKYPAALPNLAIMAVCLVRAVRERGEHELPTLAASFALLRFAAGCLPVLLACILPFAFGGELDTMWEILYTYIFHYADRANYKGTVPQWLRIEHGGGLVLMSVVFGLIVVALAWERRQRQVLERAGVLLAFLALSAGAVIVQGRFFDYHWVCMVPACAALLLFALPHVPRTRLTPRYWHIGALSCLVLLVALAGPRWMKSPGYSYAKHAASTLDYLSGDMEREAWLVAFRGRGALDHRVSIERVAAVIRGAARPDDTMCARGFSTTLHPLTGLRCTSRHLVQDNVPTGLPEWKQEYRETLERSPPTFVVTFSDRKRDLAYLERRGYRELAREGKFMIYQLRSSAAPAKPAHATVSSTMTE